MKTFFPEGRLVSDRSNILSMKSVAALKEAMSEKKILEARAVLCDSEHNLHVNLGVIKGIIPREEGAISLNGDEIKDIAIISKVNKPVAFIVTGFDYINGEEIALLSRKAVQKLCRDEYISNLTPGDVIDAKITHFEPFGAFCDIGAGISSLIPIDSISVSRISGPSDRFKIGDNIKAVVKSKEDGRITLTHKELLGTWEENARGFNVGETVFGIVRSVESYGIFIELAPNFAGLAEPRSDVKVGMHTSVYIKSIIPDKMKVKLVIIDIFNDNGDIIKLKYFESRKKIEHFLYSPPGCKKVIETIF